MKQEIKALYRRARSLLKRDRDRFLRNVSGVIHVGANTGQERDQYLEHGLRVIWIEPIPEVFEALHANIVDYAEQRAFRQLVSDKDDEEYQFHVSSNNGQSSSILDLKEHKDIWPDVVYVNTITLRSKTLVSLLDTERVAVKEYDALVMDTQGSELLVLKGAIPLLHNFKYIKTEAADFESYAGCALIAEITSFLAQYGFKERSRHKFAERAQGGSYYNVIYEKTA